MTLALQAFLLLLFILPGALFFSAMAGRLSVNRELPLISATTSWAAVVALVAAVIFHAIWQLAIVLLAYCQLKVASGVATFFTLVSFGDQSNQYASAVESFRQNLDHMCAYFLSISLFAFGLGFLLSYLIHKYRLERKYRWLRFRPRWHYLLAGDDCEDAGTGNVTVLADLLTEIEGKPVLYSGVVTKYWFDEKTDDLDVILLAGASRQWVETLDVENAKRTWTAAYLNQPKAEPANWPRQTEIPSDTFAIKYNEVKNVNVKYVVVP